MREQTPLTEERQRLGLGPMPVEHWLPLPRTTPVGKRIARWLRQMRRKQ